MGVRTVSPTPAETHRPGIRENGARFALLLLLVVFIGAMVGVERSMLPLLATTDFGLTSATVIFGFVVAFGLAKAPSNYLAGDLANLVGRRRVLILGWLVGLPVAPLIIWAPSWGWVVFANLLLGVNQGLTWSTTQIMKIDLAHTRQRGLALGANEFAGYAAVALAALAAGYLADRYGIRPAPYLIAMSAAVLGLAVSFFVVDPVEDDDTRTRITEIDFRSLVPFRIGRRLISTTLRTRGLLATYQAGFINNLKDGLAWALLPLYFSSHGLGIKEIGWLAAIYPAVWGIAQLWTGFLSDRWGRRILISAGMFIQSIALAGFVLFDTFAAWIGAAVLLGLGTAAIYPVLIAQAADLVSDRERPTTIGAYRLWRDLGYVAGGILTGVVADRIGFQAAIVVVGSLVGLSGLLAWVFLSPSQRLLSPVRARVTDCLIEDVRD